MGTIKLVNDIDPGAGVDGITLDIDQESEDLATELGIDVKLIRTGASEFEIRVRRAEANELLAYQRLKQKYEGAGLTDV